MGPDPAYDRRGSETTAQAYTASTTPVGPNPSRSSRSGRRRPRRRSGRRFARSRRRDPGPSLGARRHGRVGRRRSRPVPNDRTVVPPVGENAGRGSGHHVDAAVRLDGSVERRPRDRPVREFHPVRAVDVRDGLVPSRGAVAIRSVSLGPRRARTRPGRRSRSRQRPLDGHVHAQFRRRPGVRGEGGPNEPFDGSLVVRDGDEADVVGTVGLGDPPTAVRAVDASIASSSIPSGPWRENTTSPVPADPTARTASPVSSSIAYQSAGSSTWRSPRGPRRTGPPSRPRGRRRDGAPRQPSPTTSVDRACRIHVRSGGGGLRTTPLPALIISIPDDCIYPWTDTGRGRIDA